MAAIVVTPVGVVQVPNPLASEVNTFPAPAPLVTVKVPVILALPPTLRFSTIPTPPPTFSAPVVVEVEVVASGRSKAPNIWLE
jgi:hypothetical protein